MTISISLAPFAIASLVSWILTSILARPEGKAVETAATGIFLPPPASSACRAIFTISL